MTRAQKHLYLTSAEHRRLYGRDEYSSPSRFLRELPSDCVVEVRPRAQVSMPLAARAKQYSSPEQDSGFYVGQRVLHPTFGEGILVNAEGNGQQARVQVNFDKHGSKWLVLAYANLQEA
jgi:DNA helicase-2/ATP-dependent DNA helicase PcrA